MKKIFFHLLYSIVLTVIITSGESKLCAQDIHILQFNSSPQNLNPAQTGMFNGDVRLVANYRTQWAAIPVPYKTYSISGDARFNNLPDNITKKLKNTIPAIGILINTDKAGDSKLKTTQYYVSLALIKQLTKDKTQFISLGVQPGYISKNFNTKDLTFDNQYGAEGYNENTGSGENISNTSINYFDMGLGGAYNWKKNARQNVNIGFSAFHLNTPKQSFFYDGSIALDIKTNISGIASFPIAPKVDILPSFLVQRQKKFHETLLGLFGKYYLKPIKGTTTAVSLGAFYRAKDAFSVVGNVDYMNFNVGISYDINTSGFSEATNNRGGFELSVIYIFKREITFVAKKRVCPVYM